MKNLALLSILILLCSCSKLLDPISDLTHNPVPSESKYLGQTPPGDIPEIFAPGIVSLDGRRENVITFSPNGREFFFTIGQWPNKRTMKMEYKNNNWLGPDTASFSRTRSADEPFYSFDGNRVYYYAYNAPNEIGGSDFCYSEKSNSIWGEPVNMGSPLNTNDDEYHPCVVLDGSVYFINSSGNICYSKYKNGKYEERVALPAIINDPSPAYRDAYVSSNESFIIFSSSRTGGYGGYDLYISYKKTDGSWTNPKNLGDKINTSESENSGDITRDGKYLTFNRNGNDIYWVSASFIKKLWCAN